MIFYKIYADAYDAGPLTTIHNWQLIYDATKSPYDPINENAHDISLNMEMSAAGSLSFTLEKEHPLYSMFQNGGTLLRTTVRVAATNTPTSKDLGGAIWIGRVAHISVDYYGSITVDCEGGLSWLNDIYVRPIEYTHTEWGTDGDSYWSGSYTIVSDPQPLSRVIFDVMDRYRGYNTPKRRIAYGGVDGTLYLARLPNPQSLYINYPISYGVSEYKKYLDFLNECLDIDDCAGLWWYPVIIDNCYGVGIQIIDLSSSTNAVGDSTPKIDIDLNLVDHSEEYSADDTFTQIIPKGNSGIHINDSYYTYTLKADGTYEAQPAGAPSNTDYISTVMTSMGAIEVIKDFDCDTPPGLVGIANDYAQQYFVDPPPIVTLRAVDMASVQSDVSRIGINSIVGLKYIHINDWRSGKSYAVDDEVKYNDVCYKCITANTDTEFDNSKWGEMTNAELYAAYRCIRINANIDDPGENEYTLIPATTAGAAYYKRQLSLSRALAQISRKIPTDEATVKEGLSGINEIIKEGNRVTLVYGGSKSEVIDMVQDSASVADPTQPKHYKPVASTVIGSPN